MYQLLPALKETETKSVRALQSGLSSKRSSVVQLIQTHLVHQHYVKAGGRKSGLGFPAGAVQFDPKKKSASRRYRGGEITVAMDGSTSGWVTHEVRVQYLGFHCFTTQGGLGADEPYFIIAVDTKTGDPTQTTRKYENVEEKKDVGDGLTIIENATPDPLAIIVVAYENDEGDPDETAKNVQAELVKLSKEAASVAGALEGAADGPAAGTIATAGGALAGAWGALIAVAIVAIFGMGDDFIGQNATTLFLSGEEPTTPANIGKFQDMDYNKKVMIDGGDEGKYELYFHVLVREVPFPKPV
jgi:hypothetical protein